MSAFFWSYGLYFCFCVVSACENVLQLNSKQTQKRNGELAQNQSTNLSPAACCVVMAVYFLAPDPGLLVGCTSDSCSASLPIILWGSHGSVNLGGDGWPVCAPWGPFKTMHARDKMEDGVPGCDGWYSTVPACRQRRQGRLWANHR